MFTQTLFRRTRLALTLAAITLIGGSAFAPAALAHEGYDDDSTYSCGPGERYAERNGLRLGFREGREDALRGNRFDFWDEDDYRRASWGFDPYYGDLYDYQREFREGFRAGYKQAFFRFRRDVRIEVRFGVH